MTPTPWRIEEVEGAILVWGADNSLVLEFENDIDTGLADAQAIVKAVNGAADALSGVSETHRTTEGK